MKIRNVGNSFAVQSFGMAKKIKDKKSKIVKCEIVTIMPKRVSAIPGYHTVQVLKTRAKARNKMVEQPQIVQQESEPQQQTVQYPQNMDNVQFTNDELPFSLAEMPLEDNAECPSSTIYRALYGELDIKEIIHKEKIQNQILQNRKRVLQISNLFNNAIDQNYCKRKEINTFLTQFLQLLEKKDDKSLNGIKKQIKEVLDYQKVLEEDFEKPMTILYDEIIRKRQENPYYELLLVSLNDNLRLLNLSKKAKNIAAIIVEKTQNDELKKSINDMKSCFCDDEVQSIEQAFKDLNEVYIFNNEVIDEDIEYRENYTNLIKDAIIYEEFKEVSPSLNSFLFSNLCEDDPSIFPPVLFDVDVDLNIDDLDLSQQSQ